MARRNILKNKVQCYNCNRCGDFVDECYNMEGGWRNEANMTQYDDWDDDHVILMVTKKFSVG